MNIVRDPKLLSSLPRGAAVSIGNFDGVHWGHAQLVAQLVARAKALGGPATIFTFDPHPVRLLRPGQAPPPLTWTDRKAELLGELGVDTVVAYPTDEALLALTPQQFFDRILVESLGARAIVEGPNFFFGHKRSGDIETLRTLARQADITVHVVEPVERDGEYVSSSRVRELLTKGQVDDANQMLTRPYRVRGMVTHGAARGAKIGFPTANVSAIDTLMPGNGVYAGRAWIGGNSWPAAMNLGPRLTFHESEPVLEVHLIGFAGSLYGQPLEVDFLARLRDIQPFGSLPALKDQLAVDIERSREIAASKP